MGWVILGLRTLSKLEEEEELGNERPNEFERCPSSTLSLSSFFFIITTPLSLHIFFCKVHRNISNSNFFARQTYGNDTSYLSLVSSHSGSFFANSPFSVSYPYFFPLSLFFSSCILDPVNRLSSYSMQSNLNENSYIIGKREQQVMVNSFRLASLTSQFPVLFIVGECCWCRIIYLSGGVMLGQSRNIKGFESEEKGILSSSSSSPGFFRIYNIRFLSAFKTLCFKKLHSNVLRETVKKLF